MRKDSNQVAVKNVYRTIENAIDGPRGTESYCLLESGIRQLEIHKEVIFSQLEIHKAVIFDTSELKVNVVEWRTRGGLCELRTK